MQSNPIAQENCDSEHLSGSRCLALEPVQQLQQQEEPEQQRLQLEVQIQQSRAPSSSESFELPVLAAAGSAPSTPHALSVLRPGAPPTAPSFASDDLRDPGANCLVHTVPSDALGSPRAIPAAPSFERLRASLSGEARQSGEPSFSPEPHMRRSSSGQLHTDPPAALRHSAPSLMDDLPSINEALTAIARTQNLASSPFVTAPPPAPARALLPPCQGSHTGAARSAHDCGSAQPCAHNTQRMHGHIDEIPLHAVSSNSHLLHEIACTGAPGSYERLSEHLTAGCSAPHANAPGHRMHGSTLYEDLVHDRLSLIHI